LKILFSLAASEQGHRVLGFIDIKKAHLYAKATRDVYIELPPGMRKRGCVGNEFVPFMVLGMQLRTGSWSTPPPSRQQASSLGSPPPWSSATLGGISI